MAMICRGLDGINADGIDAQLLEVWNVAVASGWLGKAVYEGEACFIISAKRLRASGDALTGQQMS
jgi:hypothetical protein